MKRTNCNKIVFICISLLLVALLLSRSLVAGLYNAGKGFLQHKSVTTLISQMDSSSKNVNFKNGLIDLQSMVYFLTDTRRVEKDDKIVVRLENDYLGFYEADMSDELIEKAADSCIKFKDAVEEMDIPLMYVYAPRKAYYDKTFNQTYYKDCNTFLDLLKDGDVHILQLAQKMQEQGITMEEAYFKTDHHWLPETGFWAFSEICNELNKRYGFEYDEKLTSLDNYNVELYKDWFLGSQGKKVGKHFTPLGVDDISLITPDFETMLHVEDRIKSVTGTFEESILSLNHINQKDYYNKNSYAAYSGGDYPIQVIENKLSSDSGKDILVVRDSYACTVTPFLSLATKSLHILDIRTELHGNRRVESVVDYIKEYDPDYVIILYSGLVLYENNISKYEFN